MTDSTILLGKGIEEDLDIGTGRVEVPAPDGGLVVGHQFNLASLAIARGVAFSWAVGTLAPGDAAITEVAVTGAALGSPALPAFNTAVNLGISISARVQGANSVRLIARNDSPSTTVAVGTVTGTVLVFPIPAA